MKYFVAVAEELSFSRAAERMHISQPPLSQQIHALEEELGIELFERTSRKVALTAAGKALLNSTRKIFGHIEQAVAEAQRVAKGEIGELRIGFSASLPFTSLLPKVLRTFGESHPGVELTLSSMLSAEQYDALLGDKLDLGLLRYSGQGVPAGIELQEISRDALRAVVHSKHRLANAAAVCLSDLRDEKFITYPYAPDATDAGFIMHERQLCLAAGFEPKVVQEAREATTQIGLVAAGIGVALLPAPLECVHIEGVRYLPLRDASAHITLAVATRQGDHNILVTDFLRELQAYQRSLAPGQSTTP